MKHRSKWHQYQHLIRLTRRRALAGSKTAYRLYIWLIDKGYRLVPHPRLPPLACQCVRVRAYLFFRSMGYRDLRL